MSGIDSHPGNSARTNGRTHRRRTVPTAWSLSVIACAGVLLAACTGGGGGASPTLVPSTTKTSTGTSTEDGTATTSAPVNRPGANAPTGPGAPRDPLLWPYPSGSIWNHPLGSQAQLVPAGFKPPKQATMSVEEDILIIAPDAPLQPLYEHKGGWGNGNRCNERTTTKISDGLPIPTTFRTDPGFTGSKPNHSGAIVLPDYTLFETQPLHVCADGVAVSQFAAKAWQGNSLITGGVPGELGSGSHGGSGMTAFGGTIRMGEWVPGGVIPHVLKMEVYSTLYLSKDNDGYRWPARTADAAYLSEYGGTNPALRMGALIALPPSFDPESLTSEPAKILARTLRGYGAYMVDGTGRDSITFATEWGNRGRVIDEFEKVWGFPLAGKLNQASGAQEQFLQDLLTIYAALCVVDDNSRDSIGGAGDRMAPWAPPLAAVTLP